MVTVPVETPVTTPLDETVAIDVFEDVQTPPVVVELSVINLSSV